MKVFKVNVKFIQQLKIGFVPVLCATLLYLMPSAFAQQAILIDVSSCVVLESTLERFECYENQVASTNFGIPNPDKSAVDIGQVVSSSRISTNSASTSKSRVPSLPNASLESVVVDENFGLTEEPKEQPEDVSELLSTITEVREYAPNYLSITLANGQVWRQSLGKKYRLRDGYEVRIYPTSWGKSFRLAAKKLGGFIQVERVK